MTTFRLATINVHSFSTSTYDNNVDLLIKILKPYDLDLIAVQEISDNHHWSKFCQSLALNNFICGPNEDNYWLGNGIASRYPINSYSNQQYKFPCVGGPRSLLCCSLDGDHSFIKDLIFAVTHLDHINESDRIKQIQEFSPVGNNIDILMGDMNALTRDDYSDNYYEKEVVELRKRTGWEQPCFELTDLIKNQWSFQDAFKKKNPSLKDKHVVTCRFGTRIDYIYLSPRMKSSWTLKDCSIIDTQNATDHNAVMAIFEREQ